jgi:putative tricarboxylic transport membrane protein
MTTQGFGGLNGRASVLVAWAAGGFLLICAVLPALAGDRDAAAGGDRSAAEGIPRSANGATRGDPPDSSAPWEALTLIAPSTPEGGRGWTAQAMKEVLETGGLVRSVRIEYVPGDGGLAALANFTTLHRGDSHALLVGGMFMVGAVVSKRADATLNELAPIAQLTSDADVVVVPASSPYHTLDDLIAAMRRNPGAMHWAGASVGGPDHPTMWQLARAAGVAPELMHYESFQGESEVAAKVASGAFSAGIDGYSEFDGFLRRGELRGLAMVSRQHLDGISIPTFRELGIVGVSIANWYGAFAPPALVATDRTRLANLMQRMGDNPAWRSAVKRHHLRNAFLTAGDFEQLVRQEQRRITKSEATRSAFPDLRLLSDLWGYRLELLLAMAGGFLAVLAAFCSQKLTARRREETLRGRLQELSGEVERSSREALQRTLDSAAVRVGMHAQIEREFNSWGLTDAERSVAHLMLKGLRFKDIARARNTSDRTVRQQAQAIYRKAGLDGRTDLAAYFLESVLGAQEVEVAPVIPLPQGARPVTLQRGPWVAPGSIAHSISRSSSA